MTPAQSLFQPLDQGKHIVVHRGRDLRDFTFDNQNRILPLIEAIRLEALDRDLVLIEYARSTGITFDASTLNDAEAKQVNQVLSSLGIQNSPQRGQADDEQEFVQVMRGLINLVSSAQFPTFRNGRPMAFMILIEFAEHNCPEMQQSGLLSQEQMVSIELASKLSKSLGLRKSGSFVVFSEAQEGTLNSILTKHIEVLRLPQPSREEKLQFLKVLQQRYPDARISEDLDDDIMANITSNSPNRGIEQIFLSASKTSRPVTAKDLSKKKQADIIQLSEGTLEAVDTERIKNLKLVGKNIRRPMEILSIATKAVQTGKSSTLRNIILAGAPSTGKTDLAISAAFNSNIQAFTLNSPKSSLVGESERKTKLMLDLLKEQRGIGIIDELEMVLPMDRGRSANNDSGVTSNLMGQLQKFLSDSSLGGKVGLVATSNRPGSISAAMLSRWVVVPVLMPLRQDYPDIIQSILHNIEPSLTVQISPNDLSTIADRYYDAGATPREIRESIVASFAFIDGDLSFDHLDFASANVIPGSNRDSYIHSDLMALSNTRNNAFLPWWDIKNNQADPGYPIPDYIREILTPEMKIDHSKLNDRIQALEPYANV